MLTSLTYRGNFGPHRVGAVFDAQISGHEPHYGLTQLEFSGQHLFVPLQSSAIGQSVRVHILSSDVSVVLGRSTTPTSVLNVLEATIQDIREISESSVEILLDIGTPLVAGITRKSLDTLGLKVGNRVFAHIKTVALNEEITD
jgi:molybdate transport system ATP-binding protein